MIHLQKSCFFTLKELNKLSFGKKLPVLTYKLDRYFSTQKNNNQNDKKVDSKASQQSNAQNSKSNLDQATSSENLQTQKIVNQQPSFTSEQQNLIKSYEPDQLFNTIINIDPKHNFQKDLIVAKKHYEKSTKQLRASILFEDLLKSQIRIPVYDTKGKPYTHMWMKNLFNIFFFGLTIWFFESLANSDPKNKVLFERTTAGKAFKYLFYGFASWFLLIGFYKYLKFQRRFVQKIIYDTKSQSFLLTKRGFFGGSSQKQISRFKLVYTQNEFLNKKGTNYFNLDTKQEYSIPYKQSWIKQDLFSHLIAQRIKL